MKMIAELSIDQDKLKIKSLIANAVLMYFLIGMAFFLLAVCLLPFLSHIFSIPAGTRHDFNLAYFITALAIGITFSSASLTAAIQGLHDFKTYNIIAVGQTLLTSLSLIFVALRGGSIVGLAVANACALFAAFIAKFYYIIVRRGIRFTPKDIDRTVLKPMLHFSSVVFVINVGTRIIFDTDTIVIGAFSGVSAVAAYQVALGPSTALRKVGDQLNSITLTTSSRLFAANDKDSLQRLLIEATRFSSIIMFPVIVAIVAFGKSFITLWVGKHFISSYPSLIVLSIGIMAVNMQSSASPIILSLNRHKNLAKISTIEAVVNLSLSILLLHRYGIVGVALGTTIPTVITSVCFIIPLAAKITGTGRLALFRKISDQLIVALVSLPLLIIVGRHIHFTNLIEVLLAGGTYFVVFIAIIICVNKDIRKIYKTLLSQARGQTV
jgi:O-antigen/teichoic acid export membrane protein